MRLQPGSVLEKYKIIRTIGSGGSGTVYEARHLTLDRPVALKVLHNSALKDEQVRERFLREAKVMTKLEHPHSVKVFDYGEVDGNPFIVMELLQGHPLEKEITAGSLDIARSLSIIAQVCDVLAEAHRIGLVHRDVKPENIFISDSADGEPHVILVDFGLAFIAEDNKLTRLTRDGEVSGTPQFLSPEQALASPNISSASDIYSLGCVFYEMLTGTPAFSGENVLKLLNAHLYVQPESLRIRRPNIGIPAALDELVLSMLKKNPRNRPTATQVAETLRQISFSDDMRGRGKPSAFFEDREERALTANFIRRRTAGASGQTLPREAVVTPADLENENPTTIKRLGVLGEISADLLAAANTAGWLPIPFTFGDPFDIVVIIDSNASIDQELIEDYPTIVSTLSNSMDEITMLLKAGVEDVLTNPSAEEIIRKVQRLYRAIARKNRGKAK